MGFWDKENKDRYVEYNKEDHSFYYYDTGESVEISDINNLPPEIENIEIPKSLIDKLDKQILENL